MNFYSPWGDMPLATETFGQLDLYEPAEVAANVPRVVALSGLAGSGKSTACRYLATKGFTLVKFAGPLKDMCRAMGLTDEHIEGSLKEVPCDLLGGRTPRHAMQTLGTQWGRDCIGESLWVDLWRSRAEKVLANGGRVVTDDCRFANEAQIIRSLGGTILRLEGRGGIAGAHVSEQMAFDPDACVQNDGPIDSLYRKIDLALRYTA